MAPQPLGHSSPEPSRGITLPDALYAFSPYQHTIRCELLRYWTLRRADASWNAAPPSLWAELRRIERRNTGRCLYLALCDRDDIHHDRVPRAHYCHHCPMPPDWDLVASGAQLLFDARQHTSSMDPKISLVTQSLLFPILGHASIEVVLTLNARAWEDAADSLISAASDAAAHMMLSSEIDGDAWLRTHWPLVTPASERSAIPRSPQDVHLAEALLAIVFTDLADRDTVVGRTRLLGTFAREWLLALLQGATSDTARLLTDALSALASTPVPPESSNYCPVEPPLPDDTVAPQVPASRPGDKARAQPPVDDVPEYFLDPRAGFLHTTIKPAGTSSARQVAPGTFEPAGSEMNCLKPGLGVYGSDEWNFSKRGYTLPELALRNEWLGLDLLSPPQFFPLDALDEAIDPLYENRQTRALRNRRLSAALARSHYVLLCDLYDEVHGQTPAGPYDMTLTMAFRDGRARFYSRRSRYGAVTGSTTRSLLTDDFIASGARLLFYTRQRTSSMNWRCSFAAQRLLLPLLGHPVIAQAFRTRPLQWARAARELSSAAIAAASKCEYSALSHREEMDWLDRYWPRCLGSLGPLDPDSLFIHAFTGFRSPHRAVFEQVLDELRRFERYLYRRYRWLLNAVEPGDYLTELRLRVYDGSAPMRDGSRSLKHSVMNHLRNLIRNAVRRAFRAPRGGHDLDRYAGNTVAEENRIHAQEVIRLLENELREDDEDDAKHLETLEMLRYQEDHDLTDDETAEHFGICRKTRHNRVERLRRRLGPLRPRVGVAGAGREDSSDDSAQELD